MISRGKPLPIPLGKTFHPIRKIGYFLKIAFQVNLFWTKLTIWRKKGQSTICWCRELFLRCIRNASLSRVESFAGSTHNLICLMLFSGTKFLWDYSLTSKTFIRQLSSSGRRSHLSHCSDQLPSFLYFNYVATREKWYFRLLDCLG